MTKKLFRTLKITCLCIALTAALPIVSFADETTAAVKEDKMVVRIIHLDENGNLLEEDKQTATEETESSEETTDKEEANADEAVAEADSDEEEAAELEAAIEVENDLRSEIVTYALQFVGNRYKYGGTNPNTGVDCSGFTSYVMRHAASISTTFKDVPAKICLQLGHSPQGLPSTGCSQLTLFAKSFAILVLPVPLVPQNK